MSLDTSKLFLQFQILDLTTVSGGGGTIGNPLEIGIDDTTKGALYLYGDGAASTDGGEIRVYNAADHDSSVEYWTLMSNSDEFQIGANTGSKTDIIALDYQGAGSYNCNIGEDVTLIVKEGLLNVGINDTTAGLVRLYGNTTDGGGTIYFYTGANYDALVDLFGIRVFEDNLYIGPSIHNQAFGMDTDGHIFPGSSGTYNIGTAALPYGSIYANDVYVNGSSIHLGSSVVLSEVSSDLAINTDLRLTGSNPTIKATGTTTFLYIDMPDPGKGDGNLIIRDYLENSALQVQASGDISLYGDRMSLGGGTGTFTLYKGGSTAIIVECGGDLASFSYYDGHHDLWSLTASQGQPFGERYADQYLSGSLDVARDITASGTIGWDTVQLSEYNNTDLQINSDIRLTVGNPTFYTPPGSDNIVFKLGDNAGSCRFQVHDVDAAAVFSIDSNGQATCYDDFKFQTGYGPAAVAAGDLYITMGDAIAATKVSFRDSADAEVAWIDSNGNASFADILFGANTISGTGDIYCNDLYTAGSSIYLGALQLSYDGSKISIQTHIDTGQSVVLGTDAHIGDPGGADNVILGYQAGYYCDGDYNVVLGREAAYAHSGSTAGDYGVFLGYRAGYSLQSGNYNICIGGQAGLSLTGGSDNVCIGGLAGHQMTSTSYNVCIGNQAGRYNIGTGNVFLGSNAGRNNTGTNSIFIGNRAGYYETESNVLYIAVSDTATPLIYGEFNNNLVRINGDLDVTGDLTVSGTSTFKSGRDTVASGVDSHTVAFVSNFTDTDYTANVNLANFVDTPPSLYSSIITSTTVSGFSVLFSGDIDSSNYVVNYIVTHD